MTKKLLALLLALLLSLSLFACNTPDNPPDQDPPAGDQGAPSNPDSPSDQSVRVIEHHYSDDLIAALKKRVSDYPYSFEAMDPDKAPYMMQNVPFVSDGRVLSISLPVKKTTKANSEGLLVLTLYVLNASTLHTLDDEPVRTVSVKVDPASVGLVPNSNQLQWVKLDLSSYDIVLEENQSLAIYKASNSIIPACSDNALVKELIDADCAGTGYYYKVCSKPLTATPRVCSDTMVMDVEIERTYTKEEHSALEAEKAALAEMMETLSAKYKGKYISILGDSISTYANVSNNTAYNSTIGGNSVYYHEDGKRLSSADATYWGQIIKRLDMKLCVNNGYSSSRVVGSSGFNYLDCSILRATELDNSNGTAIPSDDIKPDVILFYMGTNDVNGSVNFGTLLNQLGTDTEANNAVIGAWFSQVLTNTKNGTDIRLGTTFNTLQEAYALTIYRMKMAYPDAEIYCLNLLENGWGTNKTIGVETYNKFYDAIAKYFGVGLVDLWGEAWSYNVDGQYYTMDQDDSNNIQCHPNALGHSKMADVILSTMADVTKNPPVGAFDPSSGDNDTPAGDGGGAQTPAGAVEHHYSETLITEIKSLVNSNPSLFKPFGGGTSPYALQNTAFLTNGKVRSISFPVVKTGTPNSNGDYVLTLYVCSSADLKATPTRTVAVTIKGSDHGLSANSTARKWITVDMTPYNLVLGAGQTLAYFTGTDTIVPAYVDQNTAVTDLLGLYCPAGINFYQKAGKGDASPVNSGKALIIDIEIERS